MNTVNWIFPLAYGEVSKVERERERSQKFYSQIQQKDAFYLLLISPGILSASSRLSFSLVLPSLSIGLSPVVLTNSPQFIRSSSSYCRRSLSAADYCTHIPGVPFAAAVGGFSSFIDSPA